MTGLGFETAEVGCSRDNRDVQTNSFSCISFLRNTNPKPKTRLALLRDFMSLIWRFSKRKGD